MGDVRNKMTKEKSEKLQKLFKERTEEIIETVNKIIAERNWKAISTEWDIDEEYGSYSFFTDYMGRLGYNFSRKEKRFIKSISPVFEDEIKKEEELKEVKTEDNEKKFFLTINKYKYVYRTLQVDEAVWNKYSKMVDKTNQSKAFITTKMFEKFFDWLEIQE